jgi:hypothetical protein
VNVTEHWPALNVQLDPTVEPVAVPLTVKLTIPVGTDVVPGEVSLTVTTQLAV